MTYPHYPGANEGPQWFEDDYPGSHIVPDKIVLHTTEGASWPGYDGGAIAPTLTVLPRTVQQRFDVRQHFPLDRSARALRNLRGGVNTNTADAVQIELIGTCVKGGPGMFWPEAPAWALRELGHMIARLHKLAPTIPLHAEALWLPYPASYGPTRARMSYGEWNDFRGVCGHQHVPENVHGDPGDLPINQVMNYARFYAGGSEDDMTPDELLKTKLKGQDDAPEGRYVGATLTGTYNRLLDVERKLDEVLAALKAGK